MERTVIYKTYYGIIFEEKDRAKFKTYDVIYEENGVIKLIEEYDYHSIWSYTYYISDDERIEDILQKYYMHYINIIAVKSWGRYKIQKSTIYDKNELYTITESVINEFGDEIYVKEMESIKGELVLKYTEKFIYNHLQQGIYSIYYNQDGSIKSIIRFFEERCPNRIERIENDVEINLFANTVLIQYPYYKNADFLPEK